MKFLIPLAFILVLSGCAQPAEENVTGTDPKEKCVALCEQALADGADLSSGPCLSNHLIKNWVCDVAHSPRTASDNLPENQCSAFREGDATHFVEVSPECDFIKQI